MLVLFDIDLTLLRSNGVGIRCMERAGRELFGDGFSAARIGFGGQLDPVLIAQMLEGAGAEPNSANVRSVRARYHTLLLSELDGAEGATVALPGVAELLAALTERVDEITLGLLTGNFEETGRLKLGAAGLDADRFPVRVWGDDSPHVPPLREHLPPVAASRFEALRGESISGDRIVIIGDTPSDIGCARANRCRSLGVATGRTTAPELGSCGADRVVDNLSATDDLIRWILSV